jgi:hypothetical protein
MRLAKGFSLNPRGKALPFASEHRVPRSVEYLSRRDPGSVSCTQGT